ncbi:hypothetical protein P7C70_g2249, partial [Phenoliferia sp. Uapishka_3]
MAALLYSRLLEAHPYLTLSIINGTLSTIGDGCAQLLLGGGLTSWDTLRTLRFLAFGSGIGPLAGMWNRYLEENFPLRPPTPTYEPIPLEQVITGGRIGASPAIRQSFEGFGDNKQHRRTGSGVLSDLNHAQLLQPAATPTTSMGLPAVSPFLLAKRLAVDQIFM